MKNCIVNSAAPGYKKGKTAEKINVFSGFLIETKMKHRYSVILSSRRGCVNNGGVITLRYSVTFLFVKNPKNQVNTGTTAIFQALQKRYEHTKNPASEPGKLITVNGTK